MAAVHHNMQGPMFPQELIDQIIDHLHDDKLSLVSCSLTSRRWVAYSQRHLFRSVRVPRNPDDRRKQMLPHFSKFLQSPSSLRFASYITHLHLESHSGVTLFVHPTSDFVTIVHTLSALQSLVLKNFDIVVSGDFEPEPMQLKHLVLRSITAEGTEDMGVNRLLDLFSVRDSFQVIYSDVAKSPRTTPHQIPAKHVRIVCNYGPLPFAAATTFTRLTSLDFYLRCRWDPAADSQHILNVGRFLRRHGSNVLHLRLEVIMMSVAGLDAQDLDDLPALAITCPDLQSLRIALNADTHSNIHPVVQILQKAPRTLSTLFIGIHFGGSFMDPERTVDWRALVPVLDTLPDLTSVRFMKPQSWWLNDVFDEITHGPEDLDEPLHSMDQAYLEKQFLGLKIRDILHFT